MKIKLRSGSALAGILIIARARKCHDAGILDHPPSPMTTLFWGRCVERFVDLS
jgi:hypothetical protein